MDFAALPPEVTSGWMYAGPGSGSMLSAAAAWDQLAAELSSAASNYRSVISGLVADAWHGPSSAAMSASATPYITWMSTTAEQARHAATQARAAAAAYQEAHAAMVPPAVVTANRTTLTHLVATNTMGLNTPAIAANQAQYAEMWAQDATAMHTYAANAAAATTLTPFTEPNQNTNSAGQAAATGNNSSQIPNLLQSLASGNPLLDFSKELVAFTSTPGWQLFTLFGYSLGNALETFGAPGFMFISPLFWLIPVIFSWFPQIVGGTSAAVTISDVSGSALGSTLVGSMQGGLGGGAMPATAPGVSAGLGRATTVGGLSVPQAWGGNGVRLASLASPMPAAGGLGGFHGIPPIASVVNAPRNGNTNPRNALRSKLVPELGRAGGGESTGTPDLVNPLSEKEREELDGLRAELAELVMEQDAVTRLMNQAFKA